jgi:nitrous oxidase accessory protein NosD
MKSDSPAVVRSFWHMRAFAAVLIAAGLLYATILAQSPSAHRLAGAQTQINAHDYPSLQAAIDALPEAGGAVRLPAGRFEISQPLVIEKQDALLIGDGTGTQIVNTNTAGQPAIIVRPKTQANEPRSYVWRVQLSDLRLIGNEKSGHGIEALRVNEIFIDGVTVSYHGGDGIRLRGCYEDARIANSLVSYNRGAGIAILACHDIVVAANQLEENQDGVFCADSVNLCMTGNNVDDHLRHGVIIEKAYGSVLSGNMIENSRGSAIILDRDCHGITLSANVIATNFGGGIELRDAHGCAVSGNSFPRNPRGALAIGPNSSRITVSGNAFSDNYVGPREDEWRRMTSTGITLEGTSDIGITGNTFAGLHSKALTLNGEPSRRVLFSDNLLAETDGGQDGLIDSLVADNISGGSAGK